MFAFYLPVGVVEGWETKIILVARMSQGEWICATMACVAFVIFFLLLMSASENDQRKNAGLGDAFSLDGGDVSSHDRDDVSSHDSDGGFDFDFGFDLDGGDY